MNAKEMEALIIAQGEKIQAMQEAHMNLVQRADNIVEGFKLELTARDESHKKAYEDFQQELADRDDRILQISMALDAARQQRADNIVEGLKQELTARDEGHKKAYEDFQQELADRDVRLADYSARIEKLETLVLARNASAATKRNMTDEDALRVLTGDLREASHKDAAEKIGLTYAQVYSCRLEFTFKHVHKDLRDNVKGWANPWSK